MYDLILQLIFMTSLAVIVYLMAAAVPRVEGTKGDKNDDGTKSSVVLSLDRLDAYFDKFKDRAANLNKMVTSLTEAGAMADFDPRDFGSKACGSCHRDFRIKDEE